LALGKMLRLLTACSTVGFLLSCTPDQLGSGGRNSISKLPQGTVVSGRVEVGRLVFDLPEGDWTIVSTEERRTTTSNTGTPSGSDARVMLMRFNSGVGDRVLGLVRITASTSSAPVFWNRNQNCTNRTSLHIVDSYKSEREHDCWYVGPFRPNWQFDNADAYELEGIRYALTKTPLTPVSFIGTVHWVARDSYRAALSHYTAVSTLGINAQTNEAWTAASRARSPDIQQAYQKWLDFSADRHKHYIDGLTGKLAPISASSPTLARPTTPTAAPGPATTSSDRATRLRELTGLRQNNLITEEEFQVRRTRILDGL
jgi:hypothetical protein